MLRSDFPCLKVIDGNIWEVNFIIELTALNQGDSGADFFKNSQRDTVESNDSHSADLPENLQKAGQGIVV